MISLFKNPKFIKWFFFCLQVLLGVVFIYAGLPKIISPEDFVESVENYRILPRILTHIFAIYLPYLEVICGAMLIIAPRKKGATLILLSLLTVFILAILQAIIRGLDIDCGCFGDASRSVGFGVLLEDFLMFITALLLFLKEWKKIA